MQKSNGIATASLILGIASFFCNPLYLFGFLAVVLGIIALCKGQSKGRAVWGIVLGFAGIIAQIVADLLLSVFTMGLSIFF